MSSGTTLQQQPPAVAALDEVRRLRPERHDDAKVRQLADLESLLAATSAAIARVSTALETSQRAVQQEQGMPARRRGAGVADQIGLARRISPSHAARDLAFARALRDDLPRTCALLTTGGVSEQVARSVHRETTHLEPHQRREVDARLADGLHEATVSTAAQRARAESYRVDPEGSVARAAKAAKDRRMWTRPAPDSMCQVSALLPAAQGVACFATVRRDSLAAIASGEAQGRGLGQVMADMFTERLTGQKHAAATPVEVQLVMPPNALLGHDPEASQGAESADAQHEARAHGGTCTHAHATSPNGPELTGVDDGPDAPCWLRGYGPVPAALARAVLAGVPELLGATPAEADQAQAWIRRLFTDPVTGQLVAADPRRRRFDGTVRRFIRLRDQVCRIGHCGAPIKDLDHIHDHAHGGETSTDNGHGVCQRFNLVKQVPGWQTTVVHHGPRPPLQDGDGPPIRDDCEEHPHTVRVTTPTGATYYSTAPAVPCTEPTSGHKTPTVEWQLRRRLELVWARERPEAA